MRIADFTKEGGLPFDQKTVGFLQEHSYEIVEALLSHFILDIADSYIISGCEIDGANITSGWMIIDGELLFFQEAAGDANSEIATHLESTTLQYRNGDSHENYVVKTAVIEVSDILLDDFIRIPNAFDYLTSLPDATETIKGVAEIATQAETNAGIDDTRMITPLKLKNAVPIFVPQATENVKGIAEIATQAETNAGEDDTRMLTPMKLHDGYATTTRRGIVELATNAETQAGTAPLRAVTPASLESKTATETRKGIAEVATQTETNAGTDDTRMLTPKKLTDYPNVDKLPYMAQFDDEESMLYQFCAGQISATGARERYRGKNRVGTYPFSCYQESTGTYRITHNIGNTNYGLVGSGIDAGTIKVGIKTRTANYCIVEASDDESVNNARFSFLIFKIQ